MTLEDVLNLIALSLYGETNTLRLMLKEEDEDKLQRLIASTVLSKAPTSSKSTYVSWIRYFDEGKRESESISSGGFPSLLVVVVYPTELVGNLNSYIF